MMIRPPRKDWSFGFALFVIALTVVFVAGIYGTIGYIAAHFVRKFW